MKITINDFTKTVKTNFSWQEGIGADHAPQLLRKDVLNHLQFAYDEIGFKRVRFHGMFDDSMWTIVDLKTFSPMPKGHYVQEINFRHIGTVFDNILDVGMQPFVELSFMPSQLARNKKTGLHYKNHTAPPKNWDEWYAYIKAFITFLIERYGAKEVESWYFEVWNEPDLKGFFSGSKKDYFKLYATTAYAVKAVNSNLKIGGPSTSACKWITEFIEYCTKNNVPLDFISTHHYPGDAFGNLITRANYPAIFKTMISAVRKRANLTTTLAKMFFDPNRTAQVAKTALPNLDDNLRIEALDYPIFLSEWNSMAIFAAPIHDEKYSAAFVIKTIMDLKDDFAGYFFWCVSDIFEELMQLNQPFHGGYGIITVDGIAKPNFWAFKMLASLYPKRLDIAFRTHEDVEYAVFTNGKNYQILVYAQTNDPRKNEDYEIELVIEQLAQKVTVQVIDDEHCNPKRLWQELGMPQNLTHLQVKDIKNKSRLTEKKHRFNTEDKSTIIKTNLKSNDIKLFTIYTVK